MDGNQSQIVKAFRDIGATVQILSAVGKGCPDVLVGFRGANILVEIKDGTKKPSAQSLTACQKTWQEAWAGQVCVANSIEDAVIYVTQVAKRYGVL